MTDSAMPANPSSDIDREDFEFDSHGTTCRAWFYAAQHEGRMDARGVPCIVMAHGLGGTRDAGLAPYAAAFAEAGFAVLLFDYRYFGASDGQPRQLLKVSAQQADWRAAIKAARAVDGVDAERIALWGTSFSGGHVVAAAAADSRIAAVVSQGPMLDGLASVLEVLKRNGLWHIAKLTFAAVRDQLADLAGAAPYRIPLVGRPGELAAMNTPDARDGYLAIAPDDFDNRMTARMVATLALYRPGRKLSRIHCPVLVQICDDDSVAPAAASEAMVERGEDNIIERHYHLGHFDIYRGAGFRRANADQLDFYKRALARPRH